MNIEQCMVVKRKFKPLEKRKNRTKIFSRETTKCFKCNISLRLVCPTILLYKYFILNVLKLLESDVRIPVRINVKH